MAFPNSSSSESLAQHPATMPHVGVDEDLCAHMGINERLVCLSVGVEHVDDLIADISAALNEVKEPEMEYAVRH
jgi:methionine-gamma-lyase